MLRTTLSYNRPLIRRAVFCFWWRTTGPGFFVAIGLMAMGFASLLWQGDRSWLVGFLGCTLALGLIFPVVLFGVHYRHSLRRFEAMGPPVGTLEVSQANLSLSSLGGSATLPWSRVTEIWRFDTCWLLLFSKAQFVTLPLADLGTETRAFILERVRTCGGKIR